MYDVIIVGAGAGGLGAAVYSARFNLRTLVISKNIGGIALSALEIGNWLGEKSISGPELMKRFYGHVKSLGVEIRQEEVDSIEKTSHFRINEEEAKAVIFATGSIRKKLPAKGAEKFEGRGISWCATCDAPFYKGKTVAVVGGGDAAAVAAVQLASYASQIYIFVRGREMRAEPINQQNIKKNKKIKILNNTEIAEVFGNKKVEGVMLNNKKRMKLDGIFVEIGAMPAVDLAKHIGVKLNQNNEIIVDRAQRTNVRQVYAVGDCTNNLFKQIITAAAEGAIASLSCFNDQKDEWAKKTH